MWCLLLGSRHDPDRENCDRDVDLDLDQIWDRDRDLDRHLKKCSLTIADRDLDCSFEIADRDRDQFTYCW